MACAPAYEPRDGRQENYVILTCTNAVADIDGDILTLARGHHRIQQLQAGPVLARGSVCVGNDRPSGPTST